MVIPIPIKSRLELTQFNMTNELKSSFTLGALLCIGLIVAGYILGQSALKFKSYDRSVSVKGLSEREIPADIAAWPIRFTAAGNDLSALYTSMEINAKQVSKFLEAAGFSPSEITIAAPVITDKLAQNFGSQNVSLRYTAKQTIAVYTTKIDLARSAKNNVGELGKKGIAFGGEEYEQKTEYLFTKLNDVKPSMVEEATRNARHVAEQFAADSNSKLGKIKSANQGQFTISDRDSSTPHIKKIRVVSTVDYFLSD
ncbi:SIMPL domain-containing protein [Candidatus Nitrotoga sp. HW29]|uniref:SIMPL domain-containing protein n=1 Tax=Candidatus Nitrotoga sp. HW29 TaxID=2886963 RepID=UPI001EF2DE3B|nr:SIMPL domain-containing protein [Candidatus Nitrotoga sp. HW29]CAH1905664.1 SIMPL domain-containing protein [Candidatus Nitrotoga sp. HW29]